MGSWNFLKVFPTRSEATPHIARFQADKTKIQGKNQMQASYVEVRNIVKNFRFPLTKQEIIQQAMKHGTNRIIIEDFENIPDKEYTSSNDIIKALGGN
jgi:hypothetical protein